MKFGADTADWLLDLPRLPDQATWRLRSALRSRGQPASRALSIFGLSIKNRARATWPSRICPQVDDDGNTGRRCRFGAVGDSVLYHSRPGVASVQRDWGAIARCADFVHWI